MKSPSGLPITLGNTAAARIRLIVWCKTCGHQVEPGAAEMAARYGANPVLDWRDRLVCSRCGNRVIDMVVTGTERRHSNVPPDA
jgi:DNA-directed RNA polymerase subunit RPC12/RpoP